VILPFYPSRNITYKNIAYAIGYTDGMASAMENIDIQYTYHVHQGDTSSSGGCYTTPVYHSHANGCYKKCGGTIGPSENVDIAAGGQWTVRICQTCGEWYNPSATPSTCTKLTSTVICGKKTTTIEGYSLGCGKTIDTIESATIIFN